MKNKYGRSIKTYKFRLYCPNSQWLYETKEIYNQVLEFYYTVLQKEPEILTVSSGKQLRQLELLTVGARGQGREDIKYPLPIEKVPLYFRRAAINEALGLFRSYTAGKEKGCSAAESFHSFPVFYKGMYQNLTPEGISLKVWNGEKWIWTYCTLDTCKRVMPKADRMLSPVLKLEGRMAMLHVPVIEEVKDIRTVKERFQKESKICAAAFPGNDCMAVLAVLDKKGNCLESLFIRGGKQLYHEKKQLLNRICKNRENMGYGGDAGDLLKALPEDENKYLKKKIKNLTDTYSHKTSRQIVEFCEKREIGIIVVPDYSHSFHNNSLGYLPVAGYDWLGRRIIKQLKYKGFEKGMAVSTVGTKDIASTCYICGQPVKRFNKNNKPGRNYYGGKNYICPNGHKGNAYFNSAMNIGHKFLKSQGEIQG